MKKPILYASIIGTVFGASCFIKDIYACPTYNKKMKANGKVVIITGANTGIGKETVREFADRGAVVYMACRNLKACEEARKDIVVKSKNRFVYCRQCDLSSFDSIKNFVNTFNSEQERLDILVNNAAVMRCPRGITADGIETQLGVNHMGHFLLTSLLLDVLKKSQPSRIIMLASDSYLSGKINTNDLNSEQNYDPGDAYNQSKLANILFMNELSIRLLETKVTVNAVYPGMCQTDLTRHMKVSKGITSMFYYITTYAFIRSPRNGAQSVIHAALDPSVQRVTGKLFNDMTELKISGDGNNMELSKWLWDVSEKWTRLDTQTLPS